MKKDEFIEFSDYLSERSSEERTVATDHSLTLESSINNYIATSEH